MPSRTRRSFLATGSGLSAAVLAAASGCVSGQGQQPEAAVPNAPLIELRTHARASQERDGYQKNLDSFNERFAGKYKVTYEPLPGDHIQGEQTLLAGGTAGDLLYAGTGSLSAHAFAARGAALPLDDLINKDKAFKLSDWPARAVEALRVVQNKVYALPVRGQVAYVFLFWNRDMLRQNGIPEPTRDWTLDQLVEQAKRLPRTSPDFFPIGYSWGNFEMMVSNLRMLGAEMFTPSSGPGTKCILDSPQAQQAIRWFYENSKAGLLTPRSYAGAAPRFAQGQFAFRINHLAGARTSVRTAVRDSFEWTFDLGPKGPTGSRGGQMSLDTQQITATTRSKAGAWELLKWITSKESGINLALQKEGSTTPGFRKDVYCDPRVLNDPDYPRTAMQSACDHVDLPATFSYPANLRLAGPGGIQEILDRYLNDIVDLKLDPNPGVLRELTREVQQVLDQPSI
jgi:ABC-type glycerol-3-phosphate transport system substrate-binding protein